MNHCSKYEVIRKNRECTFCEFVYSTSSEVTAFKSCNNFCAKCQFKIGNILFFRFEVLFSQVFHHFFNYVLVLESIMNRLSC